MNYYSIVIPILNEEKNIILLTDKILQQNLIHKYEIIFVDDNSNDNTINILEKLKKNILISTIKFVKKKMIYLNQFVKE